MQKFLSLKYILANQVIRAFMITLLFSSCQSDATYKQSDFNVEIMYNEFIHLDLNAHRVNVALIGYNQQIRISPEEHNAIENAFDNNHIGNLKGEVFMESTTMIFPPNNFQFKVIKNGKIISDITIAKDYSSGIFNGTGKDVKAFMDAALKILNRNRDFSAIRDSLIAFQKEKGLLII